MLIISCLFLSPPHLPSVCSGPLGLAAFTSGSRDALASSDRPWHLTGWLDPLWAIAGGLKAETERQLGGWLEGLDWQCGRWTTSLGGRLARVLAGQLAAQPDCVSTWRFLAEIRRTGQSLTHSQHPKHSSEETVSHYNSVSKLQQFLVVWLWSRRT